MALLPPTDEYGTPTEKMPRCPECNADELVMLSPGFAYCFACGHRVYELVAPVPRPK